MANTKDHGKLRAQRSGRDSQKRHGQSRAGRSSIMRVRDMQLRIPPGMEAEQAMSVLDQASRDAAGTAEAMISAGDVEITVERQGADSGRYLHIRQTVSRWRWAGSGAMAR